ncbi:C-C motif chemokine 20-like [Denticeps clupeoides]|uniref:C-C motif chemokine 20-like n=1 Tax=Denticeps clupeoides TaxID=299321 RepID=UPI0010A32682|nr:C-C motif chemokine 20-like [Denticeps clupeoides]
MAQISAPALSLLMLLTAGLLSPKASSIVIGRCCTRYSSTILSAEAVKGFSIQDSFSNCNINAVILHTKNGRHVCANPHVRWVRQIVRNLGVKMREFGSRKLGV